MRSSILSLLGLARRAGKLVLGHDPVIKAMKEKKASLILLAGDFSDNSKKEIVHTAHQTETALLTLPCGKEDLSAAVGHYCGAAALTDKGFSDKISEMIRYNNDTDKR